MSIGQSMLGEFDSEMQNTRKTLERVADDKWNWKPHEKSGTLGWLAAHVGTVPEWKLLAGGKEIFTMSRLACLRGMCLNHLYHHRGQLTVYLRLLNIPVPG